MYINEIELHRNIGQTLRERRKQIGMTQTELANKVDVLRTSITNIEAGRQRAPLHLLYNICINLGIEARDILPTNVEALQSGLVEVEVGGRKKSVPPKAARLFNELLAE